MRLDLLEKTEHSDIATAVAWSPDCQLFSCSDDKTISKWSSEGEHAGKISLDPKTFASCISWVPAVGQKQGEMFALSCTDGTFRFISRSGREEKNVKAHEGAVIIIEWCHDGSALLTAGEDGDIKIWSRSGNMRSVLISTGQPVYGACWGPDDDQILIASGKTLIIKTVQANRKNLQWNGHEGTILCVDWNISNRHIISGGEDCTYKVWDSFGRQLYSSRPMEQVVTSLKWSPNGECFAVGTFNMLRLCDKTGWTHCRERFQCGSIMDVAWTSDGTQLAGATGSGSVVFAQVVDRRFEWKNTEVTITHPRKIRVQDATQETLEDIEFARDRVVEIGLGFDILLVTTTTQCFIYSLGNLNTPIIFDIRAPPHFIHQSKRHFLTLDQISGLQIISYEGKPICAPRFQGLRADYLNKEMVALSPHTLVVVDTTDAKNIYILDAMTAKQIAKFTHASAEVTQVNLNQQATTAQERLMAFCDRNRDLYVTSLNISGSGQITPSMVFKTHSHVESFMFNDETDVLVGLADGRLNVWHSPGVPFIDKDLLPLTLTSVDANEYGRNAQIVAFTGNRISIRKVDGSLLFATISTDILILYEFARQAKWDECLRLCRNQKSDIVWSTLASLALAKKNLDAVEICLAELNEVAKVEYIQFIKSVPSEEGRQAELSLFRRQPEDAERILLQASPPLIYRAVKMNIKLYRWNRALEIAEKNRSYIDTVLAYRRKYLDQFGIEERDPKFLQYANQETDWDAVDNEEVRELEEERLRGSGGRQNRK